MPTKLAFPLAMTLGGALVEDLRAQAEGNRQFTVRWTPAPRPADSAFIIAVDSKPYTTRSNISEAMITGEDNADPIVQVAQIPAAFQDPSFFLPYFDSLPGNKLRIAFDPPIGGLPLKLALPLGRNFSVEDVAKYNIYSDNTTGTVDFTKTVGVILEDGSTSYEFFLIAKAGTHKIVIRIEDPVGNEVATLIETSVVHTTFPGTVTGLVATVIAGPKIKLDWTDPADIGSGTVKVYTNGGSLANNFADYDTILASIAAGVQTFTSAVLADGVHIFALRINDGTNEEPNSHILTVTRIDTAVEVTFPPPKPEMEAVVIAGGKIRLIASTNTTVDVVAGMGIPTKANFFTNDGAGGAVDFGTPLGAGDFVIDQIGTTKRATFDAGPFAETARKFAARLQTDVGSESVNSEEVTIIPDSTVAGVVQNVTVTSRRD